MGLAETFVLFRPGEREILMMLRDGKNRQARLQPIFR